MAGVTHQALLMAGAAPLTLSFVDSAVSNAATITIPVAAQAGDLAVLFDSAATSPSDVVPSGWTGINFVSGSVGQRNSFKILQPGDPGSSVTGMNDDEEQKVMLIFRPSVPLASATPSVWNGESTVGNPGLQNVAASGGAAPLIVFGSVGGLNITAAFSTANPAFDATVATADSDLLVGYKIYNLSPQDHAIDCNDLGNQALTSGYIACA